MSFLKLGRLATCVFMCAACRGGHYCIEGVAEGHGYNGHSLSVVEFTPDGIHVLDSCTVNHGQFYMEGVADTVRFVMLCKDNVPVIPMYLERGKTEVSLSPTEMKAQGTRQNDLFYAFLAEKNVIDNRFDDMQQKMVQLAQADIVDSRAVDSARDSLQTIIAECEDLIYGFVTSHFGEQAAVGVFSMLTFYPGNKEISPLVKRIVDVAPGEFLATPLVDRYLTRVGYSR